MCDAQQSRYIIRPPKALSTLSQKSATVAEFGDCRRYLAVFGDSRTFLRQCGQGLMRFVITKTTGDYGLKVLERDQCYGTQSK